MDKELLIPILAIWLVQAVRQVLGWVYWLQVKEYRFDRFEELVNSREGRKNLEFWWITAKFVTLFIALLFGSYVLATILLSILAIKFIVEVASRSLRKPVLTMRSWELLGTSALGLLLPVWAAYYTGIVATNLVVGEILILICPILGIIWTRPLVERTRQSLLKNAKSNLLAVHPQVIAVTGSYGKSTTKEFIAHLLSEKYTVEKTKGSQNTDFGVSRAVVGMSPNTEVFVAELGAYKQGEIKPVAQILTPKYAVITGIESQHLSLFGSLENIKKSKYELVESAEPDALVLFNYGNAHCLEMATWAKEEGRKVYGYQLVKKGQSKSKADLVARIIKETPDQVTFSVIMGKTKKQLTAPLHGSHFVENLAAAIFIARKMSVSWESIAKSCLTISSLKKTMSVGKTRDGAIIVDDSHNSTPSAFSAALDYLSLFKSKRKIVVTSGILELGKETKSVHRELGEKMKDVADQIFLTNRDFEKPLREGLGEKEKSLLVVDTQTLHYKLRYLLTQENVLLVEGRMPAKIVQLLEQETANSKESSI